ncbi:stealth family protein [bacterium]|nr:stealth family protein [bacterium]
MQTGATNNTNRNAAPIDAVVTWVNGDAEAHRLLRQKYMAQAQMPLHENAVNPHRWVSNDEILYCLQSIENHAPWVRTIWIVIDSETPDLSALSDQLRAKVQYAFHDDIFEGFTDALPTFNSLAIESMIWRIDGLSERFVYFNDDVFLTAPLSPSDVFQGNAPVLRGKWVDYSDLLESEDLRRDPAKFNHFMQLNAASLMGFGADKLFSSAHVVHPLRRSVMAQLFDKHRAAFVDNIGHRFRDLSQFLPQGLHNHACIAADMAVIHTIYDHRHIKSGTGTGDAADETRSLLKSACDPKVKFLCVNDLSQLEVVVPEAREWLARIIGGFPAKAA